MMAFQMGSAIALGEHRTPEPGATRGSVCASVIGLGTPGARTPPPGHVTDHALGETRPREPGARGCGCMGPPGAGGAGLLAQIRCPPMAAWALTRVRGVGVWARGVLWFSECECQHQHRWAPHQPRQSCDFLGAAFNVKGVSGAGGLRGKRTSLGCKEACAAAGFGGEMWRSVGLQARGVHSASPR